MSSSSPYAHSLSLLRQVSVILSEQMSTVDLYALRSDTVGGAQDVSGILSSKLHDLSSSVPIAPVTKTWTTVLASVAVPLVKFGQEMARTHADIQTQLNMLRNVIRFVWIMETIVIIGLLFGLTVVLSALALQVDSANAAGTAGIMIVMMLALVAGFRIWAAKLNDEYAHFNSQLNNALATTMLNYVNALPASQVIVVMYAIVTGSNVSSELTRYNQSVATINAACASLAGSGSASTPGLTDCNNIPTMVTMPNWIANNVQISTLLTISDALIDLKELGVDRFDRAPLWNNVRSGVDAVRSMCLVAYDDTDPARDITRDVITAAIQNEIVPILCVPGIELARGLYGPTVASYSHQTTDATGTVIPPQVAGMTLLNPPSYSTFIDFPVSSSPNKGMSLSQCARSVLDSGGEYAVGYYDGSNSLCYACSNVSVVSSSFTSNAASMVPGFTSNQLIVARPAIITVPAAAAAAAAGSNWGGSNVGGSGGSDVGHGNNNSGSSSSSSGSSGVGSMTASSLYLSGISMPWAMAGTILDQSDDLQHRLLVVLKRYKFAMDLDANRFLIDQGLASFYGSAAYNTNGISSAIDTVLSDLKTTVIKYRASGNEQNSLYIDTDRMMNKISELSNDTTTALSNTFQSLTDAATSYINLYPPYLSAFPQKLADIIALFGGGALFFAYGTYVILARFQFTKTQNIEAVIQRIIVATCLLTVCLFVTETMLTQAALRIQHNSNAMNDNSMLLVGATVRVKDEFTGLLSSIRSWSQGGQTGDTLQTGPPSAYSAPRAAAVAFLADCKGVVEKFDACNTITAQQSSLPLPLTEILLYSIVGGGVLIFAAACVNSVAPSERIKTIGTINRLIGRIADGDSSAILEAKTIVECARPPVDVEKLMTWLGIMVFAWLTIWFAAQSVQALDSYKSNLDSNPGCQ